MFGFQGIYSDWHLLFIALENVVQTTMVMQADWRHEEPCHPTVPILFCSHSENAEHSQRSMVPARQHK